MPRKASTHGASASSKSWFARSKTTKAKSKDKVTPRTESCKPTAAAAQGGGPRRSRFRSLSPNERPNPRFACWNHSLGAEYPVFEIPMIIASESVETTADDAKSSEAKATRSSSPAKNLTLAEGKARVQAVNVASHKQTKEGAAGKKRAAPGPPNLEPPIAKGYRSLFDSELEEVEEEEGAVTELQEISSNLDERQETYQANQL
ncbi:Hypothetical protein PHPALM_36650 [Phytophthora palmivora]|uniref:Uncharacterized protein n=1 Tax=Phytophthora palmivora TaxID=4796 RepID=A0A2P4WZF7_9STRA|nr:Hypothetical protein PHPALM_36650 [Phytophthora palmivora]